MSTCNPFTLPERVAINVVESSLPYGMTLSERRKQRARSKRRIRDSLWFRFPLGRQTQPM